MPVAIGPKWNGFRTIAEKQGDRQRMWTEGRIDVNLFEKLPELKKDFGKIRGNYTLDLDLGIKKAGKRLPRPELMRLNAKEIILEPDEKIIATVFDAPYIKADISELPFRERKNRIKSLLHSAPDSIKVSPDKFVSNRNQFDKAVKWAFDFDKSEGAIGKTADGKYTEGATNEWSKLKRVAELKVKVLETKPVKGGGWNYRGGLRLSEGDDWKNVKDGFVDLGFSFNTGVKASVGGIITVNALELIPDAEEKTLVWLGGNVQDVDETRKTPFTTEQAVDIAQRAGVLQKEFYRKQEKADDEGGTRSAAAQSFWRENWQDMFPLSGKGNYTYQHHWRGLDEDESKFSEDKLFDTDHSIHGDFRAAAPDNVLWGFSAFIGTAQANKAAGGDRLINFPKDKKIRGSFKLAQPEAWLTIARGKPYVAKPGDPGASAISFSKFFEETNGDYEMGVWRQNAMEVFVKSGKLKGRLLFQNIPIEGGRRIWNIDRPEDQTPIAEKRELEDVVKELKQKGQKWLVWAKPGMKPQKIDVGKFKIEKEDDQENLLEKSYEVLIAKISEEKQIASFIVTDPYEIDADGHWISPAEAEDFFYTWMEESRKIKYRHSKETPAVVVGGWLVPYPSEKDYRAAMKNEPHRIYDMNLGNDRAKSGSPIVDIKVTVKGHKIWQQIKNGEINGVSIGGRGIMRTVPKSTMPKIIEVIKIG